MKTSSRMGWGKRTHSKIRPWKVKLQGLICIPGTVWAELMGMALAG